MSEHVTTKSKRLAVDQPTRGAERNQPLAAQTDPATEELLLPSLGDGITLLDVDDSRGVPILQSIVLDHLLLNDGPAFWVDANGHATTATLSRIAPSQRLLDRIHVARGFTAYQHYSAVCDLPAAVNRSIQDTAPDGSPRRRQSRSGEEDPSPQTPSLIVAPAIDAQYRADETLGETHAETLQARTLARVATYADGYDIPALVTRTDRDDFTAPVETASDQHLACEHTRMGPRVVGDDFETLLYPVGDGTCYQTTLTYWRQLLDARAAQVGVESTTTTTSPSTPTSDGIGTGITAAGDAVPATADPWLDARTTDAGGN